MTLEPNIAELVNAFIREGRPSVKNQTFAERREGYHGFFQLGGISQAANNAMRDVTAAIKTMGGASSTAGLRGC